MNEETYYKHLVERYVSKKASDEELAVFFKLAGEGKLDEFLEGAFGNDETISVNKKNAPSKRVCGWKTIAVAASVIVAISTIAILFLNNNMQRKINDTRVAATVSSSFNSITTPRGRQQQVILPDGTKIWLNAVSSIRYPKSFSGSERIVELDGECYFEVVHNPAMPFHVRLTNGVDIEVIGTNFTVYAYSAESMKATLLEGRIKVQSKNDSATLQPGQQVSIEKSGKLAVRQADIQQALAWKNGILQFHGADVPSVMRQIERWYDVDVIYEGKIPVRQLAGKIPGNANISEVLKILELSNVHCRIDGRKITVLQDEMR